MQKFTNRTDAGNKLTILLKDKDFASNNIYIAAIPNGGIPVAIPIANYFKKPLYVMISRKIQYPWTTESGFGAITSDGSVIYNEHAIRSTNLSKRQIEEQKEETLQEIKKREEKMENYLLPEDIERGTIILVDDGLASGITMLAAIRSLSNKGAFKIIVAVPTAHKSSVDWIKKMTNNDKNILVEVLSLDIRVGYSFAVASAYLNWHDESDTDAFNILREYNQKFIEQIA